MIHHVNYEYTSEDLEFIEKFKALKPRLSIYGRATDSIRHANGSMLEMQSYVAMHGYLTCTYRLFLLKTSGKGGELEEVDMPICSSYFSTIEVIIMGIHKIPVPNFDSSCRNVYGLIEETELKNITVGSFLRNPGNHTEVILQGIGIVEFTENGWAHQIQSIENSPNKITIRTNVTEYTYTPAFRTATETQWECKWRSFEPKNYTNIELFAHRATFNQKEIDIQRLTELLSGKK